MDKLNFMNSVRVKTPDKSVFDLTHDVKFSCNMGHLIPCMVFDATPGSSFQISNDALIKLAPLVSPMYARCFATIHTWAVPYRILWKNYGDYFTEKDPSLPPAFPFITVNRSNYTKLHDYLGVPNPNLIDDPTYIAENISAMRFAAYQKIYDEFYRDQNLIPQQPTSFELVDGDNTAVATGITTLRKRAWGYDYFTSNLPFAQKGEPVTIPVAGDAEIKLSRTGTTSNSTWNSDTGFPTSFNADIIPDSPVDSGKLFADLGSSNATTINDLRLAEQLQKYLERAARSGTRLVEWIKSMFGVTLPDYTAQRPQYIGGTQAPINISEVLNTTGTVDLPQGNMSGRAVGSVNGTNGRYTANEHCVIISIMNIQCETVYQQGLDKAFLKINNPKEYLNPLFAHLGEQETSTKEIMAFRTGNDATFGYLPRFAEYRTIPSRVAGEFRNTLAFWTMSRIFATAATDLNPALNKEFIEADPTHRIYADIDPTDDKLYIHCLNRVRAVLPLPKYGTPSL